jgi:hypothetical protein
MSSYIYNLAERLDTCLFQEALKEASEQCADKVGDITAAFISLLFNLHQENGGVFVLWSNVVKDTLLVSDLFVAAFFPHKDILSWLEVFGLYFHRRGSERKIKVSTTYKGVHVDLMIGLVKQLNKQVLKQLSVQVQSTACKPLNSSAKLLISTVDRLTNPSDSFEQSKAASVSDAACQCNLPCLDCAQGAKARKGMLQRIRRLKKRMEETKEE